MRYTSPSASVEVDTETDDGSRVSRKSFLRQAVGGLALAAVGMKTIGEKTAHAAAAFGDAITGSGAFGLRVRNSRATTSTMGVVAELTSTTQGSNSSALRGTNKGTNALGNGVWGSHAGAGIGVRGTSSRGHGVSGTTANGLAGVFGQTSKDDGNGVWGVAIGDAGAYSAGVFGENLAGPGVWGASGVTGVIGESFNEGSKAIFGVAHGIDGTGVYGTSIGALSAGVIGQTNEGTGVNGSSDYGVGVSGFSEWSVGVIGDSTQGYGVQAHSISSAGILAQSDGFDGTGVVGQATGAESVGVVGTSPFIGVGGASVSIGVVGGTLEDSPGVGVLGEAVGNHEEAYAVKGDALGNPLSWAGLFNGDVYITGQIYTASAASQIDHPLDPEHKVLTHAAVESPEMKTIYDGLVTTNAEGYAEVALPDYFEVLNRDVRYQLTVVGDFAQAIVARKVEGNRFTIRTSQPGVEVSWLVSGIRADAWAAQHPTIVERDKAPSDIGHYLHPQAFGKSRDEGMRSSRPSIATDKVITPRLITPTLSRARHAEPLLSKTRAVAPADDSDLE